MRYRFLYFFLLVLFSYTACYSQLYEKKAQILSGLDLIYNFKWDEGKEIFDNIINEQPDEPFGYHFKTTIYLWHFLSNKDVNSFNEFLSLSDSALNLALIKNEFKESEDYLYIIGSIYNYRAAAFAFNSNFLDAAYASKKAESYLSKVVAINKNNFDAYLGLGLYNYAISQVPSGFSWVLKIAGIEGSKKVGYDYLKLASDKGTFSKVDAGYFFSQILMNDEFDYETSINYLNSLSVLYPDNIIFRYAKAVLLIKQKKPQNAKSLLLSIYHTPLSNFKKTVSYTKFLLGDVYYKLNMFDSASVYYSLFLNDLVDADYSGIAAYRCGMSFEMLNNHNEAIKYFRLAKNGNMDLEDDVFANRKASFYLTKPVIPEVKKLVYAENILQSGDFSGAENIFNSLLKLDISNSLKAQIYFNLSEINWYKKNIDESLNFATLSKEIDSGNEEWIKPYALYNAARVFKSKNDFFKVKDILDEAESHSGYDYEQTLIKMLNKLKVN